MKQHLSVEQMQKIDSNTLSQLLNSKEFDRGLETLCFITESDDDRPQLLYEMSLIMTIGKMIEILKNKGITDIGIKLNTDKNNISLWNDNGMLKRFFSKELADALFEALVYVLKEV